MNESKKKYARKCKQKVRRRKNNKTGPKRKAG